ncbi:MAG: serine hydroxymethyltransferase [Calditrichaeota bacterium]|nr:serine hydroxymethyltransferase [Calditrichota bacterium]
MSKTIQDSDVLAIIQKEENRQRETLELIASENFTSTAVMQAAGSVLTNKYAEGYPGARYYGGCEFVDEMENLAIERVKKLFNCDYANVQPHSGSQANLAIYHTYLKPGDTVLGMDLAHGGHLTHGSPVNFSGKQYHVVSYGVRKEDGLLDYEDLFKKAEQNKPKLIIAGASGYSRHIDFAKFREIADQVGAVLWCDMAHPAGLIATGEYPSPIPFCDVVTSTTHKTLRGPRGGIILMGKDKENELGIVAPKSGRTKLMSEVLNSTVMPGIQGGPLMHIIAAKAVAFKEALDSNFHGYTKQIIKNAKVLADELINRGFHIVSGGTDSHLMLIDLSNKDITGKDAENLLHSAGVTVNKNMVPYDTKSPFITSGIRVGTSAVTTRGFKEAEMLKIADWIERIIKSPSDVKSIKKEISELTDKFELFAW